MDFMDVHIVWNLESQQRCQMREEVRFMYIHTTKSPPQGMLNYEPMNLSSQVE